jgi:hypothetical protein
VAAWAALAVLTYLAVDAAWADGPALLALAVGQWAAFGVGAVLVQRLPRRTAVLLVLAGGALLQLLAATAHDPRRSDDVYRYAWDGRVQAAGIDPYRHAPVDPELAGLREPWLFPGAATCAEGGKPPGCSLINRAEERTIYPPVAQAAFAGVHAVTPYGHLLAWQLAAGAAAVAVAVLLVAVLGRTRGDPRPAVLWAWCPVVVLEAGNGAHVDVLAALFLVAGVVLVAGRPVVGGLLLGAAVAVKLYPALVLVALVRRPRWGVVMAAAGALVALSYVPHVLAVGTDVLGYLPGYLREEGYDAGARFALVSLVAPGSAAAGVAVALLAVAAIACWRQAVDTPVARSALAFAGTAFLLATPYQGWYGLLLVGLVPLARRPEWLAVAAAGFPLYAVDVGSRVTTARLSYGAALLVVAVATAWRRTRDGRAAVRPVHSVDGQPGRPPGGEPADDGGGLAGPQAVQRGDRAGGEGAVAAEDQHRRVAGRQAGQLPG